MLSAQSGLTSTQIGTLISSANLTGNNVHMLKFSASDFFKEKESCFPNPKSCRLVHFAVQPGIELFVWSGLFIQPFDADAIDDSGYVHFSYWLEGGAKCWLDGSSSDEITVTERTGNIGYGPGRQLRFQQQGRFCNLVALVKPESLKPFENSSTAQLCRDIESGECYQNGYRGAELHATATVLSRALLNPEGEYRHKLWLQAKGLELVALFLEGHGVTEDTRIPIVDRRRLYQARDRLLSDLSNAPTIAQLARESGINVLKLKRGFKQLFGTGVYGLYQRERMHEAYRQLHSSETSVTAVALELGYSNTSHFAAAFRKQFGTNPNEVRRGSI